MYSKRLVIFEASYLGVFSNRRQKELKYVTKEKGGLLPEVSWLQSIVQYSNFNIQVPIGLKSLLLLLYHY